MEQEPRKITLEDVKEYCKPRCLTIISNELLYELTHPKIKAIEQEPKIGHWVKQVIGYKCSNCTLCTNEKGRLTYRYCPNCGIKMIESQKSEE